MEGKTKYKEGRGKEEVEKKMEGKRDKSWKKVEGK